MVLHRYVGIAMGLLMLVWFLSGIVMLFVHWPEVTDEELIRLGDMPRAEATAILEARLPALMAEFKAAVESLGFVY